MRATVINGFFGIRAGEVPDAGSVGVPHGGCVRTCVRAALKVVVRP